MIILYFFRVYLFLLRSIGLLNVGFDSKSYVFKLNSKLAIVYCVLVNILYISLLPGALQIMISDLQEREQGFLMLAINNFVAFYNLFGVLITLINAWLRRSRLCRLLNKYARMLRKYRAQFVSYETRAVRNESTRLLMAKLITSLSRLIMFYVFLYGQFEKRISKDFLFTSLLLGILTALIIYVDINIFLILLLTNMLFGILLQQLRNIRRDVSLMYLLESKSSAAQHSCKQRHVIWRLQLCTELRELLVCQRILQRMLRNLLRVYQWQLLVALFCSFMNHIAMFFNFLLYINEAEHFHLSFFLFLVLVVTANVWNLQLLFDTCERLMQRHREMRQQLEWMLMQFVQIDAGCRPKGAELKLQRIVELSLLELQQHEIRLSICGLFNLNLRASHQMNKAVVNYLIVLVQIALKEL